MNVHVTEQIYNQVFILELDGDILIQYSLS